VLKAFSALVPGLRYVHGYGPTETTHSATLFLTDSPGEDGEEFLPIGHPLPAVDVLVVDDALRPVPDGETGELLIGGAQVMTGDYVRQRPGDGALVFLGRRDDALKINGNLVHLSEVEAATLAAADVTDCCALPVAHPLTGRAIMLFVLGARGDTGTRGEELRRELALRLPDYMLPSRIEFLADGDVSLTPSGKLDRARLREAADAAGHGTESR
ncbi:AMP-binding protein, partial [Streptomyces sp. DT225]